MLSAASMIRVLSMLAVGRGFVANRRDRLFAPGWTIERKIGRLIFRDPAHFDGLSTKRWCGTIPLGRFGFAPGLLS
jgi:hypothetical protein